MNKNIVIKGAREHNLKNIDLTIPRDKLIVFTGLSGSGKSSLAFDTIYAEGQRRYVESLSAYARQFLGNMEKPDVDAIEGLSPAISIDQKTTSRNPRSTVGTVTEIYDYLRLLYARIGTPHCTKCGREITQQTVDQIVDRVMELDKKTRIQILAPIVKGRKGEFVKELDGIRKSGFVRVRVDGSVYDLSEEIKLEKNKKHNIDVIVDRLVINDDIKSRLTDSVETATHLADGNVVVDIVGDREELFSLNYACPEHGAVIEEMSPRMFSFNNPFGACKKCGGLGSYKEIDPDLVIPNKKLSINQGAVKASGWSVKDGAIAKMYFEGIAKEYGFSLDVPVDMIPKDGLRAILYGTGGKKLKMKRVTSYGTGDYQTDFEGVIPNLKRRYESTSSEWARSDIEAVMTTCTCPDCKGARLTPEIMSVTVGGKNIYEFCSMPISEELDFVNNLELTSRQQMIGKLVINEIRQRLSFLNSVGLDYLSLAREAATLSGGEAQRIRLATQIGSSLMGVLYILDEPSIGLHQRDNDNTLIVVEHDEDTMRAADFIVDIGPGAGINGGELIAAGSVDDIINCERSITGMYLSGKRKIPVPEKRRKGNGKKLTVFGAQENNLKNIDVEFPLGKFIAVTGVSGSGKSSLVNIRELYAQTPDAKQKGYKANRFSFNVKGGRCEACEGDGIVKIEMHFLADVYVPCEVCGGKRYNRETLDVKFKGKSIFDVLEMTVDEGAEFFEAQPKIYRKLKTLQDVGLGYIKIGQSATTLSGGEAQRVKLATELSKRSTGKTIYILDEPTTGLHTADVHRLTTVLDMLVNAGNTVVVIEHNLDIIKTADYIIDLGPEGGKGGVTIVKTGTPEEIADCENSYTGQYLKPLLKK